MKKLLALLLLAPFAANATGPGPAPNAIMIKFEDNCPVSARDKKDNGNGDSAPCPASGTQHADAACRAAGDTIYWRAVGGAVDFSITEFPYPVTYHPGNVASADIPTGIGGVEIKYTISNGDGTCVLDPRIIIGNTLFMLNLDKNKEYKARRR